MKYLTKTKSAWFRSFYVSLLSILGFAVLVIACSMMVNYAFSEESDGARRTLAGDADVDKEVMLADAVLMARASAGRAELTVVGKLNADIDLNGAVDSHDLSRLLMYLANPSLDLDPTAHTTDTTATVTTTTSTAVTTTTLTTTSTSASTTTTTTTTTTTVTTATEATVTTTTASSAQGEGELLIVEDRTMPLGLGSGNLIAKLGSPTEEIVAGYENCDMKFFVYNQNPAELYVAIVANDTAVGYYAIGEHYQAPSDYKVTEYVDKYSHGSGKVFAVLALKQGHSISTLKLRNRNGLGVMEKLNWYGVNALRAMNGVQALNWNPTLAQVARAHSQEMADNGYFGHTGLDGSDPKARIAAAGVNTNANGENVDCGYTDPFTALYGWYTSEQGHRDNMLAAMYTDVGVGFAYNDSSVYKFYGTQDYASVVQ